MIRTAAAFVALLAAPALLHAQGYDTLKKIRDSKTVTIAYRTDAVPFSSEKDKQAVGYTVEICKRVVANLEQQLKIQPLAVKWVAATSQNVLTSSPQFFSRLSWVMRRGAFRVS